MSKLQATVIEAIRCYVGVTENDRSKYNPNTMRHLLTILESSGHKPDDWDPIKEWVYHNFDGPNQEYMTSLFPKEKKNAKAPTTEAESESLS